MPKIASTSPLSEKFDRDRWTAEDARRFFARWPSKTASLSSFARQHGIDPRRAYWWRGRLRQARPSPISFKEIPLPQTVEASQPLEVVLRSGVVVRIGSSFDEAALRRLLQVLADFTR